MKQIFTYPANEATYYIDPDYVGDATTGFQKRIQDLLDENYGGSFNWTGTAPTLSVEEIMTAIGKYYEFYDDTGERNISLYDFTRQPLYPITLEEKWVPALSLTHTMTTEPRFNITNNTWGIADGIQFQWTNAKIINTDEFNRDWAGIVPLDARRTGESGTDATSVYFDYSAQSYYLTHKGIDGQTPVFMRHGSGSLVKTVYTMDTMPTISRGFKKSSFTEAHDTGTLNTTTDLVYFRDEVNSNFTRMCYLDAACTIPATLDEVYYNSTTFVRTITAPAGGSSPSQINNWDITSLPLADQQAIANGGPSWARITFENLTGADATFTPNVNSQDPIQEQSALDYLVAFYYPGTTGVAGTDLAVTMYDTRGGSGTISDFTLTSGAVEASSVDIRIEFINPARMQAGDAFWSYYDEQDIGTEAKLAILSDLQVSVEPFVPYWGVNQLTNTAAIPANFKFIYRDEAGDYFSGATFNDTMYLPGQDAQSHASWSNTVEAFTASPDLDGTGRLLGTMTVTNSGRYYAGGEFVRTVVALPSTYVPPAPTPEQIAAAEDNFDLNTEWDDLGSAGGAKQWPRVVNPKSLRLTQTNPSVQTRSQSGIKYIRSGGFTRWSMEVEYPPMVAADFRLFQSTAQKARGQTVPFYFVLQSNSSQNIFGFEYRTNSLTESRVLIQDSDNRTFTMIGFNSNDPDAALEGELIIGTDVGNGRISTLVNGDNDANIYGEVKIKTDYPTHQNKVGQKMYFNPYHVVVTLSEDDFIWTMGADGLYNVSVTFELDRFK